MQSWGRYSRFTIDTAKTFFMQKVIKDEATGCWIWQGSRTPRYGRVGFKGSPKLAHRVSYELFKGIEPKDSCVCHSCDNGFCVNPDHLFLGTQGDNVRDMENKNRSYHPNRADHGRAKLTENDVISIRHRFTNGETIATIARDFPVSKTNISAIIKNRIWVTK